MLTKRLDEKRAGGREEGVVDCRSTEIDPRNDSHAASIVAYHGEVERPFGDGSIANRDARRSSAAFGGTRCGEDVAEDFVVALVARVLEQSLGTPLEPDDRGPRRRPRRPIVDRQL